ncbi:aldehyde dehydrogenase [Dendrothele bispora CBS 962.96]|uniref:Aldehyde dehydrogenase n=1 Tax=Dendrothele bispora (strain CBS 962.96) TaxID=1314807 RepID=A0A4S8M3J1_DENBC|nr:aldehyde dehydrogenase [Dendrothele bispora CBS 962.96]
MPSYTPLYINGQEVPSSSGETFDVLNPYSQRVAGTSASATKEDCLAAITAAGNAFKTWEHSSIEQRRTIFLKAADIFDSDRFKKMVFEHITEETAASFAMGMHNWSGAGKHLRATAGLTNLLRGESFPSERSNVNATVIAQRRAMGVIFAISPWNAPIVLFLRAIALPIICGNTVVFRSSELSPRTQYIVIQVFAEAGLPPGVLNFISTSKENAPGLTAEIIAHPLVRKVNFTGSDTVGRIINIECAKHLKPCVLELGGKAPAVVLSDADLDQASKCIVTGAMLHSGQICMSTERVIVQRPVSSTLISKIVSLASSLKAGDPSDPSVTKADKSVKLSALFSEGSAENVIGLLREAKEQGARVVVGDLERKGAVVQPHVVLDVKPGMRLWERESFGPVVIIAVVDTVDEAIELANSTDYSLTSSLWTSDVYKGQEIAARINAGYTNINGITIHSEPHYGLIGLGGSSGYGRFDVEDWTIRRLIITHEPLERFPMFDS